MKTKTENLIGAQLDWAVCIAKGLKSEDIYIQKLRPLSASLYRRTRDEDGKLDGSYITRPDLLFSSKWEAGGPIIELEGIHLLQNDAGTEWTASIARENLVGWRKIAYGPTPLTAAMRCLVASKLGDEIEIPEELI